MHHNCCGCQRSAWACEGDTCYETVPEEQYISLGGGLLVLLVLGILGTPTGAAVAADADTLVLALNSNQNNMDPHMHFLRVGIITQNRHPIAATPVKSVCKSVIAISLRW